MNSGNQPRKAVIKRRLNVRLILTALGVCLLVVVVVGLIHGYQVQRNARSLLNVAEREREAGNLLDAIGNYRRYLALRPNDTDARGTLAVLYDETAVTPKERVGAFLTYQETLRRAPDRNDLRRKLVDLSVDLQRFDTALAEIETLKKQSSESSDAKLSAIAGRCYEGLADFKHAAEMYVAAIKESPTEIDGYVHLVDLILKHPEDVDLKHADPQERDGVDAKQVAFAIMNAAVEKGQPPFQAHLARARFQRQDGNLAAANDDVQAALKLAADDADVLLEAVDLSLARVGEARRVGHSDEANALMKGATEYIDRGMKRQPPDFRFYLAKSRMALRQNDGNQASTILREGLVELERARDAAKGGEIKTLQAQEQNLTFSLADIQVTQATRRDGPGDETLLKSAEELVNKLRAMETATELTDFLQTGILAARGNWHAASLKFEEIRPRFARHPDLKKRVDVALAECYRRLGNPDGQLSVWRRAVAENQAWDEGRWNLAAALTTTGRIDEALEEYNPILNRADVAIEVAQLMFFKQMELPITRRNWSPAKQLLQRIQQAASDWVRVPILLAEIEVQSGEHNKAQTTLDDAFSRFPKEPTVRAALAELAVRRDEGDLNTRVATANKILDDAEKELGRKIELRLARVGIAAKLEPRVAEPMLAKVADDAANLSVDEQYRLYSRLAQAYRQLGDQDEWGRRAKELAKLFPRDVTAHWFVSEWAMQTGDQELLSKTIASIREIEGSDGPISNYLEAARHLGSDAKSGDAVQDHEAPRRLLAAVVRQRPSWSVGWRALGVLEERAGNKSQAVEHFRKAMACGDTSRDVAARVIQSLYEQQRFDEADEEIKRLGGDDPGLIAGDLARVAWQVAWEKQQFDRALGLADNVAATSKNYRDLIWLSQLRFARGLRGDEVEKPLRDAVAAAPKSSDTWFALVAFFARVGRVDDAEATIAEAVKAIPAEQAALFEAHCFELLHLPGRAQQSYAAALKADPNDPEGLRSAADFYSRRGEIEKAEGYLDRLLKPDAKVPEEAAAWARRRKALLVASRGGYQSSNRALELLDLNAKGDVEPAIRDLRAKAAILASRNTRRDKLAAVELFEKIRRTSKLSAEDLFDLAQLHEATDNWSAAQKIMLELLTTAPQNPDLVAFHAGALIRQGQLDDAQLWLGRLERIEPESFRTTQIAAEFAGARNDAGKSAARLATYFKSANRRARIEEIAKLLEAKKVKAAVDKFAETVQAFPALAEEGILEQVRGLAESKDDAKVTERLAGFVESRRKLDEQLRTGELLSAGKLLERLSRFADARPYFEEYSRRNPDPLSVLPLCLLLAKSGNVDEALTVCQQSRVAANPEVLAQVGISILNERNPAPAQLQRVEAWVTAAVRSSKGSQQAVLAQADLYLLQKRLKDAEALYRLILSTDEGNVVALNNLAWLLSYEQRSPEEAIKLINRAIDMAGHRAELIDTRGNVNLSAHRTKEAIADLNEAVADAGSPVMHLHLARAYFEQGNVELAQKAWLEGQRLGLDAQKLHPLDRKAFDQLQPKLAEGTR